MESLNPTVAALYGDHVDVKPRTVDWREEAKRGTDSDDPGFRWSQTVECPKCERQIATVNGALVDHNVAFDDEHDPCSCSGDSVDSDEGPMMNCFYPCDFHALEDAGAALAGLPLCAVEMYDGEKGLALTGGGMDLSWEICEAYIRLGHLPPVHFDLSDMSGRLTPSALLVLDAMEVSLDVIARRAAFARESLAMLRRRYSARPLGPANEALPPGEWALASRIASGSRRARKGGK